jgi:PelA/Pel-15E family pectate lyase
MSRFPPAAPRRRLWWVPGTLSIAALGFATPLTAAIIGTNPPAQPLTARRIAALPVAAQPAWRDYLARSRQQWRADQSFLSREMREHHVRETLVPPVGWRDSLARDRSNAWYQSKEARRIAEVVLSFQTPAGGWSKNLDFTAAPRAPGMHFSPDNRSRYPSKADFDQPLEGDWSYVGTFDNGATVTPLRYLAKVIAAAPESAAPFRAAFQRGLDYILAAQYPNGGWPQVWPLQGGYHDAVTYNDNALINVLALLRDVDAATNGFDFVPAPARESAAAALRRGVHCILATQIIAGGRRTVWGQQYDPLTLEPCSARNYEMPSQSSGESAGILMFLMQTPRPDAEEVAAVHAAAAWFEKTMIRDVAFSRGGPGGRHLTPAPGRGSLWARCYQIGTDRPIFGDRDKTIHDTLDEISPERQRGYAWYTAAPQAALEYYTNWSRAHPQTRPAGQSDHWK